jgi:3-hydroxybutyryl-CoA dehydratase
MNKATFFAPPASWSHLSVGMQAETDITVREEEMHQFAALSGDRSSIHIDDAFARQVGFTGPVVYGGLMVAALSRLVGMQLPGPIGIATGWKIDFHAPLYVGEAAVLKAEITNLSEAVRLVKLRFAISAGEKQIAKGSAEAKILI